MFAAFAAQDRERMLSLAHPRVVVDGGHLAERTGRRDPYRGHDGLTELLGDLAKVWDELEVTPREYRRVGRAVLMTATLAAHSRGTMLTGSVAWIYRMRRRKLVSIEVFRCRDDALAAIDRSAGTSEL
jgi:ketosteroid isomerase-like protein